MKIITKVIGDNRPVSDFVIDIEGNDPSESTIPGSSDAVVVILGEG